MATKKGQKPEDQKSVSAQEVTENVELDKSEKAALEVQESVAQNGETSGKKYKLADPKTSYQEANFTLAADQEKELPKQPSNELIARIRSGFIVEA